MFDLRLFFFCMFCVSVLFLKVFFVVVWVSRKVSKFQGERETQTLDIVFEQVWFELSTHYLCVCVWDGRALLLLHCHCSLSRLVNITRDFFSLWEVSCQAKLQSTKTVKQNQNHRFLSTKNQFGSNNRFCWSFYRIFVTFADFKFQSLTIENSERQKLAI